MLKLKNVKKQYKDFELDCSLTLESGQIVGLVGRNGAGKSTAFKIALGLISRDDGTTELFGKPIDKITDKDRQRIGASLGDAGFYEALSIKEIVSILRNFYPKFEQDYFIEKCKEFQLPLNKPLKDFSTGMSARLNLLIAISHNADLLILDEPTAGLDVIARGEILNLLQEYLEKDESRSILISSHISTDLEQLCDSLYFIDQGKIILSEDTDVLLDEYGILKLTDDQYSKLDKEHITKTLPASFGYQCLTKQRQFYRENYPEVAVEKANIDEIVYMMMGGN
ncbi:ABC transporter ATP-binding protein [Enterococcus sp.]|uniref:ABC transporter ATP-binding protein n=1 Tax=Enterococcus sp. TaxID=35783 RepID=UPI00291374E3|nr:ABC transporter ATP-binding protein [Enterococcus sp.]MDU5333301.1 ABC transporter ATP-binding protein [Enterococcus sp.]